MKRLMFALSLVAFAARADAATFDNEAGIYSLPPLPAAADEALRLDTDEREDQHPLGRAVRVGDLLTVNLPTLPATVQADLIIGFRPFWNSGQDQQSEPLAVGPNRVTALQDGPVFLRLTGAGPEITVSLTGGTALPLFVQGAMDAADWQNELAAHKGAGFVQLVSDHALVTLTRDAYLTDPVPDPLASLALIDHVLMLQDDLSGLDGTDALDQPTPLRLHFIVDFRANAADRQQFYMYATNGFIGLLPDNTGDLTNPARLAQEWGIWHEVGHIHQQYSWTWGSLTEINVNVWSLYVQQALGNPSWLERAEPGEKPVLARARDYLGAAGGPPDYMIDNGDTVFVRLVMFDQLRRAYGWDLFRDLNRRGRAGPLPRDATDQDRVDFFIRNICALTGHDLRGFFDRWNLQPSPAVVKELAQAGYPAPPVDPARLF